MSRFSVLLLTVLCATAAPGVVSTAAAQVRASDAARVGSPQDIRRPSGPSGELDEHDAHPVRAEEGRGPLFTWEEVEEMERPSGDCPPDPRTVACGRPVREGSTNEARLSGQEYPEIYWNPGRQVAIVNGEPRASLVTHPANGRRPPVTAEAERQIQESQDFRSHFGQYDHPELRPLGERCVINSSTSNPAGPPMVPKTSYNGNFIIVQTADHVIIMVEMIHDTRIIRIGDGPRLPPHIRPWFGDSWGRWEGDVLWSRPRTSIRSRLCWESPLRTT